jgi:hypothetical protein
MGIKLIFNKNYNKFGLRSLGIWARPSQKPRITLLPLKKFIILRYLSS